MPLRFKIAWWVAVAALWALSWFGVWKAPSDYLAAQLMLQTVDYWIYAHAAYPSLFALAVGLTIGTVIIPEVWHLIKDHFFANEGRPDWGMEEAIDYLIVRSRWSIGRLYYCEKNDRLLLEDIDGILRDAAAQERVSIWGRPENNGVGAMFGPATEIKIPHQEWPNLSIDLTTMDDVSVPKGVCARAHGQDQYCYLRVNKKQIFREWPAASYLRRFFDKTWKNRKRRAE